MEAKGVCKGSGESYSFNLDKHSLEALRASIDWFAEKGMPITQGVLVRRAVRDFSARLRAMSTGDEFDRELLEVRRAQKGIL
jgi:hypothetical protein